MSRGSEQHSVIELTREFPRSCQVSFDSETATLEGAYPDELSAHRARKVWIDTLESNFLLEKNHDFKIRVEGTVEDSAFALRCDFLTACGRYAFWRLTNDQAPEAQYIIETAHIPNAESMYDAFLGAPDLQQQTQFYVSEIERELGRNRKAPAHSLVKWVKGFFR